MCGFAARLPTTVLVCACALFLAECRQAAAQSQSLFGGQGPARQSSTGSSIFGGSSGNGARGRSGGPSASVTGAGFLETTNIGEISTFFNPGFVGRGNAANGFVGRNTNGQTTNQARGFRQQGLGGNRGRGNQNNNRTNLNENVSNENRPTSTRTQIRPRHEVAFDYSKPAATKVAESLRARIQVLASRRTDLNVIEVDFDAERGEATLRGSVKSEQAAKVVEAVLRLEPGVRSVRSELTIAANPARTAPGPGLP